MTEEAQSEPVPEAKSVLGVKVISWGFFGVFTGFGAAQALQSSLNATLGFINLACLYVTFVIGGFICSPIISYVVARCGWRIIFVVSCLTYVAMILSNLDIASSEFVVQPIANVFVGAGGAFIWTTQNVYFGRCAYQSAIAAAAGGDVPMQDAVKALTTRFNSIFFGIFMFSNTTGCLLSSCLMLAFSGIAWVRDLLFFVLATAALFGTAIFFLVPHMPLGGGSQEEGMEEASSSVTDALRALTDIKMIMLLPWILTNGMTYAFVNADFTSDVVSPLLGPSYVGFIAAAFFCSDMLFTMLWGQLIAKKCLTRRLAFMGSALFWVAFLVVKMAWTRNPNFEKSGSGWERIPGAEVTTLDVVLPVVLAVLGGGGDGFWSPGPPAILQSFFADSNLIGTMGAYKAVQSLGFALQFTLGAVLHPHPELRSAIVLGCCVVSVASVLSLDFKHPLDPRARELLESLSCQRDTE